MSAYTDDDDIDVLRVRDGSSLGKGAENSMLRAMGGAGTIRKRFMNNPDGSVTMAHTRGAGSLPEFITSAVDSAKPEVFDDLYLDSGFVLQGSYAPLGTTDDAQALSVQQVASTATRYAYVISAALKVIPKAFTSFFQSFSTRLTELGIPSDTYADALKAKNKALLFCPPTMFTGLARRYVAAIYGKKVKDAATYGLSASGSTLTYDGVGLSANVPTTGILFSPTHKKYWLVQAGAINMGYQELKPKGLGVLMLDMIGPANSDEENAILHSYVLSTARVLKNASGEVTWRDGGMFSTQGDPLSLGWRFNADGSKATMVTVFKPSTQLTSCWLYSATIDIHENTGAALSDPARFGLTMTVSEVERQENWTCNKIRLFQALSIGQYKWMRTGDTAPSTLSNVPLISFYDDLDALQVCRFSFNTGLAAPETSGQYTGNALSLTGYVPVWPESVRAYGSGYTYDGATRAVGDGAIVSLGNISLSEEKLTSVSRGEYVVTQTAEYLVGGIVVTAGTAMQIGNTTCAVNGSPNTGLAATWSLTETVNVYRTDYTWEAVGYYAAAENTTALVMLVAPGDCATAWLESSYRINSKTARQDLITPAVHNATQHTHRWVATTGAPLYNETGGSTLLQSELLDLSSDFSAAFNTNDASNVTYVRNAKGRSMIASTSSESGAEGPFWAATVGSPVVDFEMVVQDDFHSVYTASNVLGGSALVAGWPTPTYRSIGWQ